MFEDWSEHVSGIKSIQQCFLKIVEVDKELIAEEIELLEGL